MLLYFDASMYGGNTTPKVSPGSAIHVVARLEASVPNHLSKLWLRRELAYALDEVLVRVAIASENGSEERDNGERVLVV